MKTIFLALISIFSYSSYCQNLVPNYSFEDENICELNDNCNPSAWFDVFQQPHGYRLDKTTGATGNRWINVITGCRLNKGRQYWQTLLLNPMTKGKRYKISLSVRGWFDDPYPMDIGLYFTDGMIPVPIDTLLQPKNYLGFTDAKFKELKGGWFKMEKQFIATENSRALVVGNFSDKDYMEIAKHRYSRSSYISIKVDDIEIIPFEEVNCENCLKIKDSLYSITRRHYPLHESYTIRSSAPTMMPQPSPKVIDSIALTDLFFDFGRYTIKSAKILEESGKIFSDTSISKILIIGYTDDVGSGEKNLKLSEMRALEVSKLLTSKFQIAPNLIVTQGKGASTLYEDKQKNRRVDVFIYH